MHEKNQRLNEVNAQEGSPAHQSNTPKVNETIENLSQATTPTDVIKQRTQKPQEAIPLMPMQL